MRVRQFFGGLLTALGTVLILSALFLLVSNLREAAEAARAAEERLQQLQKIVKQQEEEEESKELTDPEMTVVELDGYGYIGYLSIPVLDLNLPVMSDWDYQRLKTAPCRQSGSTKTDDLVIAGHNYTRHFGTLKNLAYGDVLTFTDMEDTVSAYLVKEVCEIASTDTDIVFSGAYDLVLYTCTYGGKTRVMVGCERITEEQLENMVSSGR